MSFFQKPSDEPNPPISVTIYGAGGGGNHSPAQLGGSNIISGYNNVSIKPNTYNTIDIKDHMVQGQMLMVEYTFDGYEKEFVDDTHIKNMLIQKLVQEILNSKCVEFTKQYKPETHGFVARARIYVTPDTHVRLIRTYQK